MKRKGKMKEFTENVVRKNQEAPEMHMTIVYGYAFGTESEEKEMTFVIQFYYG